MYDIENDPDVWIVKFVVDQVRRQYTIPRALTYDDVLQQGYVEYYLMKSRYDPEGGGSFANYVFKSLKWRLLNYIVEYSSLIKKTTKNYKNVNMKAVYLDKSANSDDPDNEGMYHFLGYEDDTSYMLIKDFMDKIREDERIAIIKTSEGYNQREIGAMLGTTHQNISAKLKKLQEKWRYHNDATSGTYFSKHVSSNGKSIRV